MAGHNTDNGKPSCAGTSRSNCLYFSNIMYCSEVSDVLHPADIWSVWRSTNHWVENSRPSRSARTAAARVSYDGAGGSNRNGAPLPSRLISRPALWPSISSAYAESDISRPPLSYSENSKRRSNSIHNANILSSKCYIHYSCSSTNTKRSSRICTPNIKRKPRASFVCRAWRVCLPH